MEEDDAKGASCVVVMRVEFIVLSVFCTVSTRVVFWLLDPEHSNRARWGPRPKQLHAKSLESSRELVSQP